MTPFSCCRCSHVPYCTILVTLPETNIAPKNGWLGDEFLLGFGQFSGALAVSFGGGYTVRTRVFGVFSPPRNRSSSQLEGACPSPPNPLGKNYSDLKRQGGPFQKERILFLSTIFQGTFLNFFGGVLLKQASSQHGQKSLVFGGFFLHDGSPFNHDSSQHPGDKVNSWSIWEMYLGY